MRTVWLILSVFLTSCTITSTNDVRTGLFNNELKTLSTAYQNVDKLQDANKNEVEAIGFDFNAPNVERVSATVAFRRIFGDTVFQTALCKIDSTRDLLKEMSQYYAYYIPYRYVVTREDRFYFSRKDVKRVGDDLLIIFIFKRETDKDVLVFHDYNFVRIDSKDSSSAFAQGVFDIMDRFGNNIQLLVSKMKDLIK